MPEVFGRSSPAHHHPLTVAVVVGSFAMAVGLVVRISGMSLLIERQILSSYMELGFPVNAVGQPWWAVLVLLESMFATTTVIHP